MDTLTLQELISRVADGVRDIATGVTTASSVAPNQFIDTGRKGIGKDREWASSQVIFLQPEAGAGGIADNTAFDVSGYAPTTATFTLARNVTNLAGVPQNVPYILIRHRGQGYPYRSYLRAIEWAIKKQNPLTYTTFTVPVVNGQYDYTIPAGIQGIYEVQTTVQNQLYGLRPLQDWSVLPGRVLRLSRNVPVSLAFTATVYAMGAPTVPTTFLGTISGDADELVDYAIEYLQRGSMRPQDNAKAGNLQQERLRFNTTYVPANYVEVV